MKDFYSSPNISNLYLFDSLFDLFTSSNYWSDDAPASESRHPPAVDWSWVRVLADVHLSLQPRSFGTGQ